MKRQLVLIAFMVAGVIVNAQERGKGRHHRNVALQMKEELSLTEDQFQRMKTVDESYRVRFHDLRIDSTRSKEQKTTAMKALGDARRREVDAILTPVQQEKWKASQSAHREEQKARFQKASEDRELKLKNELSLSDKQFSKIKDANKSFHEKTEKLRHNSTDAAARKAEFGKLREAYEKDMKSILSKDQYQKWQEMKKRHHGPHGQEHRRG